MVNFFGLRQIGFFFVISYIKIKKNDGCNLQGMDFEVRKKEMFLIQLLRTSSGPNSDNVITLFFSFIQYF
jgi:hypothetical protein